MVFFMASCRIDAVNALNFSPRQIRIAVQQERIVRVGLARTIGVVCENESLDQERS